MITLNEHMKRHVLGNEYILDSLIFRSLAIESKDLNREEINLNRVEKN